MSAPDVHPSPHDASPLAQVQAQIIADLEATQGPWRAKPRALRVAVAVAPAVVVFVAALLLLSPGRGVDVSVIAAGVAAALALAGVSLAPDSPSLSERFAQSAAVAALLSFVVELAQMQHGGAAGAIGCASVVTVVALVAALALALALRASGAPLRMWHRLGLATAAALGASSAVWHHCASHDMWHVLLAHAAVPVVVIGSLAFVVGRAR